MNYLHTSLHACSGTKMPASSITHHSLLTSLSPAFQALQSAGHDSGNYYSCSRQIVAAPARKGRSHVIDQRETSSSLPDVAHWSRITDRNFSRVLNALLLRLRVNGKIQMIRRQAVSCVSSVADGENRSEITVNPILHSGMCPVWQYLTDHLMSISSSHANPS